jgi:hypothetical protein
MNEPTNIKHVPTYLLIMYKGRWNLMYKAGIVATYLFTPPYTLSAIEAELKIRKEAGENIKG